MTDNSVRRPLLLVMVTLASLPVVGGAQGLVSASSAALSITAPTETDYDAGSSASSPTYTVTTSCTGTGSSGCRLFIQYGSNSQGQQLYTQWALISATPASRCKNLPPLNVFTDVVPTNVILATKVGDVCSATFALRVSPLSYSRETSPGPVGGAYKQQLRFVLTRP